MKVGKIYPQSYFVFHNDECVEVIDLLFIRLDKEKILFKVSFICDDITVKKITNLLKQNDCYFSCQHSSLPLHAHTLPKNDLNNFVSFIVDEV
jgi:hypothetical protein